VSRAAYGLANSFSTAFSLSAVGFSRWAAIVSCMASAGSVSSSPSASRNALRAAAASSSWSAVRSPRTA
jgi:hypothetical protein